MPPAKTAKTEVPPDAATTPSPTDPEWTDYCMSLLGDGEYTEDDGKRYPRVPGLRRLVMKLIGDVIYSNPEQIEYGSDLNGYVTRVVYRIKVRSHRDANVIYDYSDVADVDEERDNPEFARFGPQTASTRAAGRVLRKLLGINRVAAEEMAGKPYQPRQRPPKALPEGSITPVQKNSLEKNFRDLNINPDAFLAKYSRRGAQDLSQLTKEEAAKALKLLNDWFQKRDLIDPSVLNEAPISTP